MANNYGGPFGIRSADNDSAASIGGAVTSGTTGSVLFVGAAATLAQDNANFFWDDTNNRLGLLTAAPTHSLTLGSTATGVVLYNTADQTTDYERAAVRWSSSVAKFMSEKGGTGTLRDIQLGDTANFRVASTLNLAILSAVGGTSATTGVVINNANTYTSTSLVQVLASITGTVNQTSGTGGYTALLVNPTLTAVGSAGANLLNLQAGSVNKFRVSGSGNTVLSSAATSGIALYNTADEVTDTEFGQMFWSASILKIRTAASGTGSNRNIQITAGSGAALVLSASGFFTATGAITTGASAILNVTNGSSWSSTSLVQDALTVTGTVNQASGTGGFRGLVVNPTLTAVGSAGAWLMDLQVASASMLRVNSTGRIGMSGTVTAGGTTGNQTINKPSGTVNIAAAGTTVTVTNSTVTANSIVTAVIRTNDGTATLKNVVPSAGSFVITLTAAATAETSIGFVVVEPI